MKRGQIMGITLIVIAIILGIYFYLQFNKCDSGYKFVDNSCILKNIPKGIVDNDNNIILKKGESYPEITLKNLSEYFKSNDNGAYDLNWIFYPEKYSNYECKNSNKNPIYIRLLYRKDYSTSVSLIMCDSFYFLIQESFSFGYRINGPIQKTY